MGYATTKRLLDIVGATIGLILSAPVLVVAAVAIKLDSPGPVFFRQRRIGRGGKAFVLWKLRGMYADAPERFPELYCYDFDQAYLQTWRFKQEDDPRVTRVGRVLRALSIDELPNLLNVVLGDMSLVGPRPEIPELVRFYTARDIDVLRVKPGVTSPAKVLGRDRLTFRENLDKELDYVRLRSLSLDLKTLVQTIEVVLSARNVFDAKVLGRNGGPGRPLTLSKLTNGARTNGDHAPIPTDSRSDVWPTVSVIMPVRNEREYIERSLNSVVQQDYPRELVEVLVVDGMSHDGTRAYVEARGRHDSRIRLLDNPRAIVPNALNIGLREAKGAVIVRVDGHCEIAADYLRNCIATLMANDVQCVGGPIKTVGTGLVGAAIAAGMSSPFGVGSAHFRTATGSPRVVDHLAFGAYPRRVFDEIGGFDEEFVRNQDDEFSFRLTRAGGRLLLTPTVRSQYFARHSVAALWRQYFDYGYWKVRVIQKHGRPASWRHLVPVAFVIGLIAAGVVSATTRSAFWITAVAVPYVVANLTASSLVAARRGWKLLPVLPVVFTTLHVAYGSGFLNGLWAFAGVRRRARAASPAKRVAVGRS